MSVSRCVSGPIGMHKWCGKVRNDEVEVCKKRA